MLKRLAVILVLAVMLPRLAFAGDAGTAPFDFLKHETADSIRQYIEKNLPLGSSRDDWRKAFVTEGGAELFVHPRLKGVEKYLFDVNLCKRAVFRWNISADFDGDGKLLQAYINGRFVFMAGKEPRVINMFASGGTMQTYAREKVFPGLDVPEARVAYRMRDIDGNPETLDDQMAEGDAQQRADPASIGMTMLYKDVELWRSFFDPDETKKQAEYKPCTGNMVRDPALDELLMPEVEKIKRQLEDFRKQQGQTPKP